MKNTKYFLAALALPALAVVFGCGTLGGRGGPEVPKLPIGDGTVWYYRAFGQSVDLSFNEPSSMQSQRGVNNVWLDPPWLDRAADPATAATFVTSPEERALALRPDTPVKLDSFSRAIVESRGGKWSNTHVGMTFFFTVLPTDRNFRLTADVTKAHHGANPDAARPEAEGGQGGKFSASINSQSGGAMLAMDVLNQHRMEPYIVGLDELPAITNIAAVGFRGNNTNTSKIIYDGNLERGVAIGMPTSSAQQIVPETQGRFPMGEKQTWILERRDSGFYVTVINAQGVKLADDVLISDNADLVQRVEKDRMYWGFAAVRQARLMVENIRVEDTGAAAIVPTTAPRVAQGGGTEDVLLRSGAKSATPDYNLVFRGGWDGRVKISRSGAVLFDGDVKLAVEREIPVVLEPGENVFSYEFAISDSRYPAGGTVQKSWTIDYDPSALREVYAAPSNVGNGSGSNSANAMSLATALANARAGQSILLAEGDYGTGRIAVSASGSPGNLVKILPAPGVGRVRFNGITLSGNFLHVNRLVSGGTGPENRGNNVEISGDFNILEDIISEWSTNSGFNSGGSTQTSQQQANDPNTWPKGTLYLNCESRYNWDASNGADGFALKNAGPGNRFVGCVSHHNIDDGWDFFNRVEGGPSFPIIIENSIAYSNGANGFKLGGETQPARHELRNSLAFDNRLAGISCNFNPGPLLVEGNVSIDNWDQNIILRLNRNVPRQTNRVANSISYRSESLRPPVRGLFDSVAGTVTGTFMTDAAGVSRNGRRVLSDADFVIASVDFAKLGGNRPGLPASLGETAIDSAELAKVYTRDGEGNLTRGDYGRLRNR